MERRREEERGGEEGRAMARFTKVWEVELVRHGTDRAPVVQRFIRMSIVLGCLASILLGYDISIMSSAIIFVEKDMNLTTLEIEVIVSAVNFAALFGSFYAGGLSDKVGRRKTIFTSSIIFLVGAVLMAVSAEFWSLLAGRVVTGLGVGVGLLIAPLYVAEMAPADLRGRFVSITEISITVGLLIGYVIGFLLGLIPGNDLNWRLMLGLGGVPAIMLLVGLTRLKESPRWFVLKGRHSEAAEVVAMSSRSSQELEHRMEELIEQNADASANSSDASGGNKGSSAVDVRFEKHAGESIVQWVVSATPQLRRRVAVGFLVAFFQQATGIEAAIYYTPSVLKQAGMEDKSEILGVTVAMGALKLVFTIIASRRLDKWGRRWFLMVSSAGIAVSLVMMSVSFILSLPGLTIAAQGLFISAFALGWGPVCWVYVAEIFPLQMRGRCMGVATTINRLTSAVVALGFLSLAEEVSTAGVFLIFLGMSLITFVFIWYYVEETKGKSLEEIERDGGAEVDQDKQPILANENTSNSKNGYLWCKDDESSGSTL